MKLEEYNFKIDSTWWEEKNINWVTIKINKEWDVVEYTKWRFKWEQLFSWNAAMRETKKYWKKIPTHNELKLLIKSKQDIKNIPYVGFLNTDNTIFELYLEYVFLWTSTIFDSKTAYYWSLFHFYNKMGCNNRNINYKFSVRCISKE